MRLGYLTEDQSDWIKFGYEESQIDAVFYRKGAKAQRRSETLAGLCAFAPFAGEKLRQESNCFKAWQSDRRLTIGKLDRKSRKQRNNNDFAD
jgi:hypothetical protein